MPALPDIALAPSCLTSRRLPLLSFLFFGDASDKTHLKVFRFRQRFRWLSYILHWNESTCLKWIDNKIGGKRNFFSGGGGELRIGGTKAHPEVCNSTPMSTPNHVFTAPIWPLFSTDGPDSDLDFVFRAKGCFTSITLFCINVNTEVR